MRKATPQEIDYVLSMARDAIPESIEADENSIVWSEPGTSGEFSTQNIFYLDPDFTRGFRAKRAT